MNLGILDTQFTDIYLSNASGSRFDYTYTDQYWRASDPPLRTGFNPSIPVARPWERKFLAYTCAVQRESRLRIAPERVGRLKQKVREHTQALPARYFMHMGLVSLLPELQRLQSVR